MGWIRKTFNLLFIKLSAWYIEFVYHTSKITREGDFSLLEDTHEEKFVIGFWHGDSYCLYPVMKNSNIYIITTKNKRGDYVAALSERFGYIPIRISDESKGENDFQKLRRRVNVEERHSMGVAMDGPIGPYQVPKKWMMLAGVVLKRKVLLVSIHVKRKMRLRIRWDKYVIPFPFNVIEVNVRGPLEVNRKDLAETENRIKDAMRPRHEAARQ